MAIALEDGPHGTTSFRGYALEGAGGAGNCFFYDKVGQLETGIVLGIGDGRLQGLCHNTCGFARYNCEHMGRLDGRQPLDLPHNFAHFLRGHADILGDRKNFHTFWWLFGFGFGGVSPVFLERAG